MRVCNDILIPIDRLLESTGVIYEESTKQTLVGKPIILNEKPIGVITSINEKYAVGLLWLDLGIEYKYSSTSASNLITTEFNSIYINNKNDNVNELKEYENEWDVIRNIFQKAIQDRGLTKEQVHIMSTQILKEVRSEKEK